MANKKSALSDTWNQIPAGIKVFLVLGSGYLVYRFVNKQILLSKQRAILRDQQNPAYNLPSIDVDGTTLQNTNTALLAAQFYKAYNPDGWNTDEAGLINALGKTAPQYYRLVENYYLSKYGRNLTADLDEQLGSDSLYSNLWEQYKSQIF